MRLHRGHSPATRFWSRVSKTESCWLWNGANDGRYGFIRYQGKQLRSHQFSWILHHGILPTGAQVLHKCDVTNCVNPAHLFLGDHVANMRDKAAKGRAGRVLTKDKVIAIRALSKQFNQYVLAEQFGVDQSLISRILKGELWPLD